MIRENHGERAARLLGRVREEKPLVHNITNFVVMNETANITLCAGGLPVMAHALEEVEEMAAASGALVLNIGTLWPEQVEAMVRAGRQANKLGIPVLFDPVGAGATRFRTESAKRILDEVKISITRGNSAEIAVLSGMQAEIRGVEATGGEAVADAAGAAFAKKFACAAAVTGKVDVVAGPDATYRITNGHQMMSTVTGTGCMATAVTGVFAAVERDGAFAAAAALAVYGLAGQIAAEHSKGPGMFHARLYDALAGLTEAAVTKGAAIEEV